MSRDQALRQLRAESERIKRFGVTALYLFGSTARDEAGPDSDVDLFVDPDSNYDRFGFVELFRLEAMLADGLGRPVDLTTREGLHPRLRPDIEREAVQVFG
jgi:uncharacterized protein